MESRYNHCNPHFSSFSFPPPPFFFFFACQNFWKFGPPPLTGEKSWICGLLLVLATPPPPSRLLSVSLVLGMLSCLLRCCYLFNEVTLPLIVHFYYWPRHPPPPFPTGGGVGLNCYIKKSLIHTSYHWLTPSLYIFFFIKADLIQILFIFLSKLTWMENTLYSKTALRIESGSVSYPFTSWLIKF